MSETEKTPSITGLSDERVERRWPHLVVLHGTGVGEVHRVIGAEATIGRDPSADIQIDHPTVSRRHARLTVVGDRVFIEDLRSTNGTLVGVNPVRGRRIVHDGAVIALGRVTLLKMTYAVVLGDALRRAAYERATRDLVTRVASLEYLTDQLRVECAYARRHRSPLTLVFFRADDLSTNADPDNVDAVMGRLAVTIYEATRDEDILARSARDEFVVLLRSDADHSVTMAERVRLRVAEAFVVGGDIGPLDTVTATVVQLGRIALAAPNEIIQSATRLVREAVVGARDSVVRLPPLEAPPAPPESD